MSIKPKNNIAAIIQARMGSTRLPGKVLMEVAGKPLLWHAVERVKKSKKVNEIVIATTTNPEDDAIAELCKKEHWLFSRGSCEDVLGRYYGTAKQFGANVIVRLTSDCPLIDPMIIDECVEKFIQGNYDFISNCESDSSTFPRGLDVRVISFAALQDAHINAKKPFEREHVWPYIFDNKKNNIGPVVRANKEYQSQHRLTVDYPEDFALMEKIYQTFYRPGKIVSVPEVIEFLNQNPDIANINAKCEQKSFQNA